MTKPASWHRDGKSQLLPTTMPLGPEYDSFREREFANAMQEMWALGEQSTSIRGPNREHIRHRLEVVLQPILSYFMVKLNACVLLSVLSTSSDYRAFESRVTDVDTAGFLKTSAGQQMMEVFHAWYIDTHMNETDSGLPFYDPRHPYRLFSPTIRGWLNALCSRIQGLDALLAKVEGYEVYGPLSGEGIFGPWIHGRQEYPTDFPSSSVACSNALLEEWMLNKLDIIVFCIPNMKDRRAKPEYLLSWIDGSPFEQWRCKVQSGGPCGIRLAIFYIFRFMSSAIAPGVQESLPDSNRYLNASQVAAYMEAVVTLLHRDLDSSIEKLSKDDQHKKRHRQDKDKIVIHQADPSLWPEPFVTFASSVAEPDRDSSFASQESIMEPAPMILDEEDVEMGKEAVLAQIAQLVQQQTESEDMDVDASQPWLHARAKTERPALAAIPEADEASNSRLPTPSGHGSDVNKQPGLVTDSHSQRAQETQKQAALPAPSGSTSQLSAPPMMRGGPVESLSADTRSTVEQTRVASMAPVPRKPSSRAAPIQPLGSGESVFGPPKPGSIVAPSLFSHEKAAAPFEPSQQSLADQASEHRTDDTQVADDERTAIDLSHKPHGNKQVHDEETASREEDEYESEEVQKPPPREVKAPRKLATTKKGGNTGPTQDAIDAGSPRPTRTRLRSHVASSPGTRAIVHKLSPEAKTTRGAANKRQKPNPPDPPPAPRKANVKAGTKNPAADGSFAPPPASHELFQSIGLEPPAATSTPADPGNAGRGRGRGGTVSTVVSHGHEAAGTGLSIIPGRTAVNRKGTGRGK